MVKAMKTAWGLLLVITSATAQDFKDPIRTIHEQRVHLHPLFIWWTNAAALNASNASLPEAERQPLPERPLRAWVRITSTELTNTGFTWLARVDIQKTPDGPISNQLVVLRHGPFEEKKALDQAVAHYNSATESQLTASNVQSANLEREAALRSKASLYQEMYNLDPHRHYHLGLAADTYRRAAIEARHAAGVASNRVKQLEASRAELFQITQGRHTLMVDTFALRTGETYQGLPVFEMGLRYGR